MAATPIHRVYADPNMPYHRECRAVWGILEILFGDIGGVEQFEPRMHAYQEKVGRQPIFWDHHLVWLIKQGQTEAAAQRTVVQQMLVAAEWIR